MKVTAIICPLCDDRPWSRHRHDMRYCKCGYCYIDGGRDYARIGYGGDGFDKPWEPPEEVEIVVETH